MVRAHVAETINLSGCVVSMRNRDQRSQRIIYAGCCVVVYNSVLPLSSPLLLTPTHEVTQPFCNPL